MKSDQKFTPASKYSTAILIPARYGSTRFPGKPLCKLGDKTMIETVYDKCVATGYDTYVLTDDMRIFNLFNDRNCYIDEADYLNGTERCAGAIKSNMFINYDYFINVQGDMPDVTEEMITKASWLLKYHQVSTVITQLPQELKDDPNSVKLVRAGDKVLWCGRGMQGYGDWHLGIYGFSRSALKLFPDLTITNEERIEGLEQLRWLKSGWTVGVTPVSFNGIEINNEEDLNKWQLMHQS